MQVLKNINIILSNAKNNKYEISEIKLDKILEFLEKNCSIALENFRQNIIIYRGVSSKTAETNIFVTKPLERISYGSPNVYTRLMSGVLPSWKNYPKRSESFICTTSKNYSSTFGKPYIIFPFNNPKIGICTEEDLWDSFTQVIDYLDMDMDAFNYEVIDLLAKIDPCNMSSTHGSVHLLKEYYRNMFISESDEKIYKTLETTSNTLITAKKINNAPFLRFIKSNRLSTTFYDYYENGDNFISFLDFILDPAKNDFKLIALDMLNNTNKSSNELWFSCPAVFIKEEKYQDLKEKLI